MLSIPRQVLTFALLVGAVTTSACSANAQRRTAETFRWEGPLRSGATVEVKGVNGAILAQTGSGSNVRVEAVRSGRRNDPSEVQIVVLEHSGGLTICAVYPTTSGARNECAPGDAGRINARNNDVQVEFTIQIPESANLTAATTNGAITAERIAGDVRASSTNGGIRIEGSRRAVARTTNGSVTVNTRGVADVRTTNGSITARMQSLDGASDLHFATTNGQITLGLPQNANVNIDASTTNGGIESEFPVTVQGRMTRNRLSGTIGSGGPTIEARTTNGRINIQRGG